MYLLLLLLLLLLLFPPVIIKYSKHNIVGKFSGVKIRQIRQIIRDSLN